MTLKFHSRSAPCVIGIGLISLWISTAIGSAQGPGLTTPKRQLPSGTLLNNAPNSSQWKIAFSYPQDQSVDKRSSQSLQPNLPRAVLVTKTQSTIHEEILLVSGRKLNKWQVGQTFYVVAPGTDFWGEYDARYRASSPTTDPSALPIPDTGFRNLEWVNENTYAGTLKTSSGTYFVFVPSDADKIDINDPKALSSPPKVAYIDANTRLPATLRVGEVVQNYSFLTPPGSPLSLPADLQASIKKGDEIRAKADLAPK